MKEINFNGLHITDYEGSGDALIFVHAFPLSSKMWNPQVEFFKNKFRIITYDVRGLGKSNSVNNLFTMESYANDLLNIIEYLKLEKVIACGLSMGGYIIQRSFIKKPEAFKALILADTKSERDDDNSLISRSNVIESIKSGKRKEFVSEFLQKLINKKSFVNPDLKNFLENIFEDNTDEGICGAQLALATRINAKDYLCSFNIPVLILVGEDDILTPISSAEIMKNLIPDSEMKIIKQSGHLSNLENTVDFNRYLMQFLEKFL
jgi:3-oxoadipate enol-lactonase